MDEAIDGQGAEAGPELRDYLRVLRRWIVLVVSGLVLGLAVAALLWARQPVRYTATATVLLRPIVRESFNVGAPLDRSVDAQTERRIALSRSVAEAAGARLEPPLAAEEMLDDGAVTVPGDLLLRIAFVAGDPAVARDGAQAWAEVYLERRRSGAAQELEVARRPLAARLETAQAELAQVVATLAVQRERADDPALEPDELTVIQAQTRQDVLVSLIQQLEGDLLDLEAIDISGGQVLDPAVLPTGPSTPTLARLLVIGGTVGLMLGVLGAFLREALSRRLLEPARDLPPIPLPVVGRFPLASARRGSIQASLPAERAMRELRNRLVGTEPGNAEPTLNGAGPRSSTVTMFASPQRRPDSGSAAGSFASVLSLARQETLLVRADLRSAPVQDGPGPGPGLAEVLAGKATLDEAVRVDPSSTLMTLEAGAAGVDDPDLLLQPENLEAFFEEARRLFRQIVVDAPPLLPHLDDLVLARYADRILICVQPRVTDLPGLRDAVAQLRQAGGPVTGAVVVGG